MEENGDIVNVGGEEKKEGKDDVKWVKFEERKLVEDKGIQFDIQRSVENVRSDKEKEHNDNNEGIVNVENNNNNNVKDNNVLVVVEENKHQQQEIQVNNVNSNVNEQQQQVLHQQHQQQPITPLSSLEVFNILNEVNFEMDTISNNITTTLNFDPDKSIKHLITQVNSLHPDNNNTNTIPSQKTKYIEDRGTQPSYIIYLFSP